MINTDFFKTVSLCLLPLIFSSITACSPKVATSVLKGEIAVLLESESPASWRLRHKGSLGCNGADATAEANGKAIGSQIRLKDGSGKLLGVGIIQGGTIQRVSPFGACLFSFSIEKPLAADFYTLEIDNYGSLSLSHQELEQKDWQVGLTLSPGLQTISNNLEQVRQETEVKKKSYEDIEKMSVAFEDAQTELKRQSELSKRAEQKMSLCLTKQELANFSLNDEHVLSDECRTLLEKSHLLRELVGVEPDGHTLKYRTDLSQKKLSTKRPVKTAPPPKL